MIGFIVLSIALLHAGCAQEYQTRGRAAYRSFDDDEVEVAKPAPTVVPILKQIDRHNDDGSYTYGFEAADGSFKIETKQADGEVRGKYGYTDATGKLHVVEYGANKHGFQPAGEGIMVPPVNLNAEPEPEYEEPPRPQPKQQKPRPRPAVQQIPLWEQAELPIQAAPAPIPAPAPRPKPAQPHIIYNSPTPKRPQFFAGAQPIPDGAPAQSYEQAYEAAAPRRPVAQPRPQPPARTLAFAEPAPVARPAPAPRPAAPRGPVFDHSTQFRQNVKFAQPLPAAPAVRYERPEAPQLFRPEPTRAQFAELEQYDQEEAYVPAPAPRPVAKAPAPRPKATAGFLDQLEQQFSLPNGQGQPTHNIAFGFY